MKLGIISLLVGSIIILSTVSNFIANPNIRTLGFQAIIAIIIGIPLTIVGYRKVKRHKGIKK